VFGRAGATAGRCTATGRCAAGATGFCAAGATGFCPTAPCRTGDAAGVAVRVGGGGGGAGVAVRVGDGGGGGGGAVGAGVGADTVRFRFTALPGMFGSVPVWLAGIPPTEKLTVAPEIACTSTMYVLPLTVPKPQAVPPIVAVTVAPVGTGAPLDVTVP
jgi:hypothetical protein